MVNSVAPGALGVNPSSIFATEPRHGRASSDADAVDTASKTDSVSLSRAPLSSARVSVIEALRQVELAREVAREAQALLVAVQGAGQGEGSQAALDQALATYAQKVELARADGGVLLVGEDVPVQAEPGASGLVIGGADLQLKVRPSEGGIIQVPLNARAGDPSTAAAAQVSLDRLQAVVGRLSDSAKALEAHERVLSVAEAGVGARVDLNADSARLMALQVRQGLEQAPSVSIANSEPQAVLALFRA